MIFVTVGTHEQPFDRLLKYVDEAKEKNIIDDEIVIQSGFSKYEPKYCRCGKFYSYEEIEEFTDRARIVITHGGPSSFIAVIKKGKIPIVVPREKRFGEHVNDHQVEFVGIVAQRNRNIIEVRNFEEMKESLLNYDKLVTDMKAYIKSNNSEFNEKFEKIAEELFENKEMGK
ncbi:MAG: multidrug MFS transporter [Firmicutes bacterium]|nr:multidrug MFS transporter [Bacillota bacterium]